MPNVLCSYNIEVPCKSLSFLPPDKDQDAGTLSLIIGESNPGGGNMYLFSYNLARQTLCCDAVLPTCTGNDEVSCCPLLYYDSTRLVASIQHSKHAHSTLSLLVLTTGSVPSLKPLVRHTGPYYCCIWGHQNTGDTHTVDSGWIAHVIANSTRNYLFDASRYEDLIPSSHYFKDVKLQMDPVQVASCCQSKCQSSEYFVSTHNTRSPVFVFDSRMDCAHSYFYTKHIGCNDYQWITAMDHRREYTLACATNTGLVKEYDLRYINKSDSDIVTDSQFDTIYPLTFYRIHDDSVTNLNFYSSVDCNAFISSTKDEVVSSYIGIDTSTEQLESLPIASTYNTASSLANCRHISLDLYTSNEALLDPTDIIYSVRDIYSYYHSIASYQSILADMDNPFIYAYCTKSGYLIFSTVSKEIKSRIVNKV